MQLLLATLCDSAADYQGKLCILGAFDTLCAQEFPVVHPQCSLAVRLLFYPEDAGRHNLSIQLEDEVGQPVMPAFTPTVDVVLPPGSVPFVTRNLVLNLQRLRFEEPGVYRFEIMRNGKQVISLPLRVARLEEMRPTMGPAG
ncbi:MAG TPA: hypothetical protein VLE43_19600 [Candidatus Saccharimonadia bacterium]|nr:hypothetical protein [Candidatus Saccharimonadia bacterium]